MIHEAVTGVCIVAAVVAVVAWRRNVKEDKDECVTRVRKKANDLAALECAVMKTCKEMKHDRLAG